MRRAKGFTLMEFLIYFGIVGLIISAVISFSLEVIKTRNKGAVVAEVEQNMRMVSARLLRSIRTAAALDVGGSTFGSDNGVLSLTTHAAAANPTVFDLSAGAVRMKEGALAAAALTSPEVTVSKLRFTKDNIGGSLQSVTFVVTMAFKTASADPLFRYETTATGTAMIRKQ